MKWRCWPVSGGFPGLCDQPTRFSIGEESCVACSSCLLQVLLQYCHVAAVDTALLLQICSRLLARAGNVLSLQPTLAQSAGLPLPWSFLACGHLPYLQRDLTASKSSGIPLLCTSSLQHVLVARAYALLSLSSSQKHPKSWIIMVVWTGKDGWGKPCQMGQSLSFTFIFSLLSCRHRQWHRQSFPTTIYS